MLQFIIFCYWKNNSAKMRKSVTNLKSGKISQYLIILCKHQIYPQKSINFGFSKAMVTASVANKYSIHRHETLTQYWNCAIPFEGIPI